MKQQNKGTPLTIDLARHGGTISPRLFGHNLEHTRSCVWQGLSAQLLRNRKFYGKPQRNGVALDWYAIRRGAVSFELNVDDYTTHYDPADHRRSNEVNGQQIELCAPEGVAGIGQDGIALHKGWRYEGRVAWRVSQPLPVVVRFAAPDGAAVFEETFDVQPGLWREVEFHFAPESTCENARIEVTFTQAATLCVGAVSLLPANHFRGMRRDVVDLLKTVGCTVLRWPGGNFAGDYRWQDGLLPVDRRAPLAAFTEMETLPHTRGFDCHEIGTDEFLALCREIGAEPYITINLGWDSPEMAAAWVEYCNGSADSRWGRKRAERGHAAPYGVKLWSLGNELGYGHMEGPNAPADYVKRAKACARAMRKVDPSIQFLMSGLFAKEEWFTEGLSGLAGTVDYVSHHHYSRRLRSYAGDCATQDFFRVATAPGAALKELRRIREETDARSQAKRIGISFDEWNVWYAWYRHPGVVDGIHHASMLNMLCREAGKLGISMACFFEPVNEGAILVEPFRAYLPAGGQVFPMLKNHAGNTLLHLAPQDPAADLDATASLNRRTNRIVLTLVNRSPVAGQKVAIVLRNANPVTVDGSLLAAPNYLPGTDFTEGTLPVKHRNNELGVVLPKHSVALLTVQLKEHPTQPKAGRTRAPSRRPKGRG